MSKMKQVVIDNQKGVVMVDGKQIPRLLLSIIRGAVGKRFVVKHYRGKRKKLVVTRYPVISGIVASEQQRVRRDLFREAVVYARWIISDEERKKAFRKKLPGRKQRHVYQAAIQLYMSRQGDQQWLSKQLAVKGRMKAQRGDVLGRDGFDQQGIWNVMWCKRVIKEVEVKESCVKENGCLKELRI
jgi:hypothetical protein